MIVCSIAEENDFYQIVSEAQDGNENLTGYVKKEYFIVPIDTTSLRHNKVFLLMVVRKLLCDSLVRASHSNFVQREVITAASMIVLFLLRPLLRSL